MWGSKKQSATSVHAWMSADTEKVPKGYVPVVLVDVYGEEEEGQRILVHVRMLREPCMAALLEMAEQQFGLSQRGVLRVPCTLIHFQHIINSLMD